MSTHASRQNFPARIERACSLQALDAFQSAAEFPDAAFASNVNNNTALALFRLGRHEEALVSFRDALSSVSTPEAALYYNRGESTPHLPALQSPSHAAAGTMQLKLSDWTSAARDFEAAIALSAETPVYHYAFGVALERISRREEA